MDHTAVAKIVELGAQAASKLLPTHEPAIVNHKDYTVVSLEHLQPGRARFSGKFATSVPADFARYIRGHLKNIESQAGEDGYIGFINKTGMSAALFFNRGTNANPGHCDDIAELALKATAPYKAALEICNRKLSQRDLSDWLEDWRDYAQGMVRRFEGDETYADMLPLVRTIAAIRNVSIEAMANQSTALSDHSTQRSALEKIEARSTEVLPTHICFTCVPYEGLIQRPVYIRLNVLTSEKSPTFVLRIVNPEQLQEELADEFKDLLTTQLPEIPMVVGSFTP